MTQVEYRALYRSAHLMSRRITAETARTLKKVFKEAARRAALEVAKATSGGLSDLTSSAWTQIYAQLQSSADIVSKATEEIIPEALTKAYRNYGAIDVDYVMDAVELPFITREGMGAVINGVETNLVFSTANRIYQDGYTFSERIWNLYDSEGLPIGINGDFQYRVKNLILTGQAHGRDAVKIAQDIQVYAAQGRDAVFKPGRYGRLIPGTARYARRISKTLDWRSLRLVRSEMNASLQEAGKLEGRVNPAASGLFDWVKTPGNPIDPDPARTTNGKRCIDLEADGPYEEQNIPDYNHPNCSCSIRPVLRDQRDFVEDLKNWSPGSGPEYLNNWYNQVYSPAQAGVDIYN
jgi:hypothetical protein